VCFGLLAAAKGAKPSFQPLIAFIPSFLLFCLGRGIGWQPFFAFVCLDLNSGVHVRKLHKQ